MSPSSSLPVTHTRALGQQMETWACHYLEQHGLELLTRNYHARCGELDLVMIDAGVCVFIEVRYRFRSQHGSPLDSVTPLKQRRIVHTAHHYLMHHPLDMPCRFDIIGLNGQVRAPTIEWVRHAFDAC